ncbi:Vacuolar protein sorting-associated protein 17 [Coemansia sp. RSA 2336]|nr:Vacuolar protein sorting-associated protein 17 [Coemansia sp. RSA 2336]
MYSDDEIDPHREQARSGTGKESLYDSIDPFAEARPEAETWNGPEHATASDNASDNGSDDDSDNRPLSQTSLSPTQATSSATIQQQLPLLRFTVGQMVDRSKRTPGFTFDVLTTLPSYKGRKYSGVERNQIEFERLESHLRATYPECLVPTLGPGTTVSKYVPDYQNDRLVVLLLQQWLNRISVHPILRQDYELRQFVEAPFAFNPALTPSLSSGGSALSLAPQQGTGFFSWGKPKQRITRSANPSPFEQQLQATSENMELFQKNLSETRRWHGRLARTRGRLALDLKDVGTKLVSLGVIERSAMLGTSFKRLGKCFLHVGACAHSQSNLEGSRPIAVEDIYMMACENVQKTLSNRQVIFTEHQVSERQLERKRQSVAVLRASANISPEQVQETLAEFNVAKADADSKRQRAERVDKVLAADLQAFETNRENDFRAMFTALGRDQLHVERQVLNEFKAVLDFVRQSGTSSSSSSTTISSTQQPPATTTSTLH